MKKIPERELVNWAKRNVRGLDQSHVFVGVMAGEDLNAARIEFTLHLGHALLTGKPIVLTVPYGIDLPNRLILVADHIVRYDPDDIESLKTNLAPVLVELGVAQQ